LKQCFDETMTIVHIKTCPLLHFRGVSNYIKYLEIKCENL